MRALHCIDCSQQVAHHNTTMCHQVAEHTEWKVDSTTSQQVRTRTQEFGEQVHVSHTRTSSKAAKVTFFTMYAPHPGCRSTPGSSPRLGRKPAITSSTEHLASTAATSPPTLASLVLRLPESRRIEVRVDRDIEHGKQVALERLSL